MPMNTSRICPLENKRGKKTQPKHKPNRKQLPGYICGRKVCQGQFTGCRYSKVQEVLKLQLAGDRINLCLAIAKDPLLAVRDWPSLAPCLATLTFLGLYLGSGRKAWVTRTLPPLSPHYQPALGSQVRGVRKHSASRNINPSISV